MTEPAEVPAESPSPSALSEEDAARREALGRLADLLDSKFRIPGTERTFGLDAIIGIIPGIGDVTTLLASAAVVTRAVSLGARGWTLAMMLFNMALDATVGTLPIAGTVFDVFYKANSRNVALLQKHHAEPDATREETGRAVKRSLLLVALVTFVVSVLVVIGLIALITWFLNS